MRYAGVPWEHYEQRVSHHSGFDPEKHTNGKLLLIIDNLDRVATKDAKAAQGRFVKVSAPMASLI